MALAFPTNARFPKESNTRLSIMEVDGVLIVVDQYGHMIPDQLNVSASSGVGELTQVTLTFNSANRNG
ncbi:MAG: hypothetical protein CL578_22395 [Alteromonadaceae bacterium]|jgi:hypothetical protein|uniref:hypothetical protein n=1 Tax=unclassified Methylophaga TaxID=2629249 RepID=UPI000C3C372B|nr:MULTISPECIES: hypothetical protein [unclassified Methylophaga]MAP27788.1 hypothetical protein [Methylophaga sp.]MBN27778.1 hypothetical protein [Alteromonadaceae bacterium]HAD31526.1 hypothetical protein [Methylophaga sp.]HCN99398.1 hypothetical protein [Methylophaga sp.]|tara:strand:- start:22146 stop:22349 length:204 start_codon:yes stop_codon:yes gene_type:complete